MKGGICVAIAWLFLWASCAETSATQRYMQTPEIVVVYDEGSLAMAEDVAAAYPVIQRELRKFLPWDAEFVPWVVLVTDRRLFAQAAGSEIFLAYAVPQRYHMVIDASRAFAKPFTLEATLKHELCHLVLHHHIPSASLPRWLDEGVCQWVSSGISELLVVTGTTALERAVVTDSVMQMRDIDTFPADERSVMLAYEQSKSFIEFIVSHYGRDGLSRILLFAGSGHSVEESIQKGLSISLSSLEDRWRSHLRGKNSWVTYLSGNIYTILFLLGGIVTIYGFLRFLKKKREYMDEEDGDGL
jgi:hypothetical protein